jgi:hypothetical protein
MRITENSKLLISFFMQNKFITNKKITANTKIILRVLYEDITNAYNQKLTYNMKINKIDRVSDIPRPKTLTLNGLPETISKSIYNKLLTCITYTFSLYNRTIVIKFVVEETDPDINIYNRSVDTIIMWLYILNKYSSPNCSKVITIYLYLTSLRKKLPNNKIDVLNENNVNTAFTTSCQYNTEIVIFRSEEWLKVLLHETFHSFGLDFSDMNTTKCNKEILGLFKVSSKVNLYEAYVECWAEIMNALFCSFFIMKNKLDFEEFVLNAEILVNIERYYSFFQMVKTLKFMGLNYVDLYSGNERVGLYKEKTSVLSYYIIKLILINNFQDFLEWCYTYNNSLLQFNKTFQNQMRFCEFIKRHYKTKTFIKDISNTETFLNKLKKKENEYLLTNMRMSICELG